MTFTEQSGPGYRVATKWDEWTDGGNHYCVRDCGEEIVGSVDRVRDGVFVAKYGLETIDQFDSLAVAKSAVDAKLREMGFVLEDEE